MAEASGILLLNAEDNSESGLTITEEGSNNFSIATGAKAHGTYGYNFAFSGNSGENLCYFSKSFTAGADIYARLYFYIPSGFASSASYMSLIALRSSTSQSVAAVRALMTGTTLALERFYYQTNAGNVNVTLTGTITRDTWHYIEVRYKSGAGDGAVGCWYDGTEKSVVSSLTNNSYQAGYVFAGQFLAAVPTADSPFYVDDIKVDSSAIGEYTESGGSTGNSYYYQQQQM